MLRERMETEKESIRDKKGRKSKNGKVDSGEQIAAGTPTLLTDESRRLELSMLQNGKRKADVSRTVEEAEVAAVVRPKGSDLVMVTKKYKASDKLPDNATKSVYASIFTSSSKGTFKETYSCRSLPLGRN